MSAKEMTGTVIEVAVVAKDYYLIRFRPNEPLHFQAGQFLSLRVPTQDSRAGKDYEWRLFSFANPPESTESECTELYILPAEGGITAPYLASLRRGETITFRASFGNFQFHSGTGRGVVLISTGTGLAPLRSIARSQSFLSERRPFCLAVIGFQYQSQIPFHQEFEKFGIETRYTLSRAIGKLQTPFFSGRVTDFLKKMSDQFPWQECDYYICGNSRMIREVRELLAIKLVDPAQVYFEAFEADEVRIRRKNAA